MKKIMMAGCAAVAVLSFGFAGEEARPAGKQVCTPEMYQRYVERKLGGELRDVRKQKGKIVIVNAQKLAKSAWLDEAAAGFDKELRVAVGVETGAFDLKAPAVRGQATVFVVDDPALPMSLVAPEAKWAMVNVATLKTDKEAFFSARVRKLVTRGMAYVLGAADSRWPMCLLGCVTKAEDLDQFRDCRLPVDVTERIGKYAKELGITQYAESNYLEACQEGWAPAPTNKYQQRIWDKTHQIPTKPLKLEK